MRSKAVVDENVYSVYIYRSSVTETVCKFSFSVVLHWTQENVRIGKSVDKNVNKMSKKKHA